MITISVEPTELALRAALNGLSGESKRYCFTLSKTRRHHGDRKPIVIHLSQPLVISAPLILENATGRPITFVPGSKNARTFLITSTFFGVKGSRGTEVIFYGGVSAGTSSETTLFFKHCIFSGNQAVFGGAIFSLGQVVTQNCLFIKNVATEQGGAIWAGNGLFMSDTTVTKNKVSSVAETSAGGGMYVDSNFVLILNSEVTRNTVRGGAGGGVVLMQGYMIVRDSSISKNVAFNSPGVQQGIGNIYIVESKLEKNHSFNQSVGASGGGAVTITQGDVFLKNSVIYKNRAKGMFSAGILSLVGNVDVFGSEIRKNRNAGPGGGIAQNFGGSLVVNDSVISSNRGASLGGGIVNFSAAAAAISLIETVVEKNQLSTSQTIGETLASFLQAILQSTAATRAQAAHFQPAQRSVANVNTITTLIEAESKQWVSQALLVTPPRILSSIGGCGVATLLGCPLSVNNSILSKNEVVWSKKSKSQRIESFGGGIFALGSPLSTTLSRIQRNVVSNEGSGIFYVHTLITSDSFIRDNLSLRLHPKKKSQIYQYGA